MLAQHHRASRMPCRKLDKTQHVAQNPPFTGEAAHFIDVHFRDRWRSIVGVDDMIAEMVSFLENLKLMETTYIFFSSDHGYKVRSERTQMDSPDLHLPLDIFHFMHLK